MKISHSNLSLYSVFGDGPTNFFEKFGGSFTSFCALTPCAKELVYVTEVLSKEVLVERVSTVFDIMKEEIEGGAMTVEIKKKSSIHAK